MASRQTPGSLTAAFLLAILTPVAAIGLTAAACFSAPNWMNAIVDGTAFGQSARESADLVSDSLLVASVVVPAAYIKTAGQPRYA